MLLSKVNPLLGTPDHHPHPLLRPPPGTLPVLRLYPPSHMAQSLASLSSFKMLALH